MTKKYFFLPVLSIIVLGLAIASCSKDETDTTKPVISVAEPEDGDTLVPGHDVHFEADFSDDIELKSYKIDIHNNFDGHSHKTMLADSTPWLYQKSWDFEAGKKQSHIHQHDIVVPDSIDGKPLARGNYHFMIYLTDAAGNESWKAINIVIHDNGTIHEE